MRPTSGRTLVVAGLMATSSGGLAMAQCEWRLGPENSVPGLAGDILALTVWDPDGLGPLPALLVAGGANITKAGLSPTSNIAGYDGTQWAPLAGGVEGGEVRALAVYDGALIVAGDFTAAGGVPAARIARYDGSTWSALGLGLNGAVNALAVVNGQLYAAGAFTTAGGAPAKKIARWNGSMWSALGLGLQGPSDEPRALAGFLGSLYVGGVITNAGGVPVSNLAVWNGSGWLAVNSGPNGPVNVLKVRDNGITLPTLIAGGDFTAIGGTLASNIARMDTFGVWWSLGAFGVPTPVRDVAIRNTGPSAFEVVAAVDATSVYPHQAYVLLPGGTWGAYPLLGGPGQQPLARAVVYHDFRYTIGSISFEGHSAVRAWDGQAWAAVGPGIAGTVWALEAFGPDLFFAGDFLSAGGVAAAHIARWNGSAWSALGTGTNAPIRDMIAFENKLYVTGEFSQAGGVPTLNVARWTGATWESAGLGSYASGPMGALAVHDGELYVSGRTTGSPFVARRQGNGTWEVISTGLAGPYLSCLASLGGRLYAGATGLAFGTGATSSPMGSLDAQLQAWAPIPGIQGALTEQRIQRLVPWGGSLYAGGRNLGQGAGVFLPLATVGATTFTPLADIASTGTHAEVWTMAEYSGALYAAGEFDRVNGQAAAGMARLSGGAWSPVSGLTGIPMRNASAVFQGELVLAGGLTSVGGAYTFGWARWHCPAACYPDCNGDAVLNLADFGCFQTRFATQQPYADCNGDTLLNLADFGCFQTRFALGCP